ncbi:MAG: aldehyde dehydrogenase family protein [Acidimicrobiales bacterium]
MTLSFNIISPVDGSMYRSLENTEPEEGLRAISAARTAQPKWAAVPLDERKAICRRFVEEMQKESDKTSLELTWQMGRPIAYAPGELNGLSERALYMIGKADDGLASLDASTEEATRRIDRVPLGVCLVVAPWNYPFLTSVNTIIPAILAGNSVVLKAASQTALTGESYAAAFEAAGLPEGVFTNILPTHAMIADWISTRAVDFVAFTGSVGGGAAMEAAAVGRFLPVSLELGGKDPAYVRADADLEFTVPSLVDGSFFNSGQSCCAIERIYVDRSIHDQFVADFVAETKRSQILGDPTEQTTTLGPVVNQGAARDIRAQIAQAVDAGAELLAGENDPSNESNYIPATVLSSVDHSMQIMSEETFGPAIGIIPVDGDDAALELMNDSKFGLSASIWSTDRQTAAELGRSVQSGTLFVNRCDYLDPALAWVGVKDSGRGCTLSELGFHHVTRPMSFFIR